MTKTNSPLTKLIGHLVEGMAWSKERPTVADLYLNRRKGKVSAVEVRWEPTDSDGHGTFDVRGENLLWSLESFPGEWCPITLPTDAPAQAYYKAEEVEELIEGRHKIALYDLILELSRLELEEMSAEARTAWERLVKGGWYTDDLEKLLNNLLLDRLRGAK